MPIFKFKQKELEKALQFIKISVNEKNPDIPQHGFMHVTFRIKEGKCQSLLRSFNGISSCDLLFESPIETDQPLDEQKIWEAVVKVDKLYHIVSKSKKKIIIIKFDESFKVQAEGTSTINMLNKDDWFLPPTDEITPYIDDFPIEQLSEAWSSTYFTIADDIVKYDMRGIYFDGNWVTTDGRCISIYQPDAKFKDKTPLFMSPEIESLIKIIKKKIGITKMKISVRKNNQVIFIIHSNIGKFRYMLALNNTEFPSYKTVAEKYIINSTNTFSVKRNEMLNTLNRLSIFLDVRKKLQLILENKKLKLMVSSADTASESYEHLDVFNDEFKDQLNINIKYDILYKIISENTDENIKIKYENNATHLVVQLKNKYYISSTLVKV